MRGAVAAGHPLTAEAGAEVLGEGGNAVDACIAAAFVVVGRGEHADRTGRRRLHARPPRARESTRVLDFFVTRARATASARPARRPWRRSTIDFTPGRRRSSGSVPPRAPSRERWPGSRRPTAATRPCPGECCSSRDRARPRGRRADEAAGVPARDPRPDPPPHRRGPRDVRRERNRLVAGDRLVMPDLAADARAARRARRGRLLPRRAGAGALEPRARARRQLTLARPARVPRHPRQPVRISFGPRVRLEPAALAGGVLIGLGLPLDAWGRRPARQRRGDGPAVEIMREQETARGGPFTRELYRGGLARRLADEEFCRGGRPHRRRRRAGAAARDDAHLGRRRPRQRGLADRLNGRRLRRGRPRHRRSS